MGELTGKTVGLIGCGIIGRRLLELLEPFRCTIYVHDPYVPRELADIYDVTFTTPRQRDVDVGCGHLSGAHHARPPRACWAPGSSVSCVTTTCS